MPRPTVGTFLLLTLRVVPTISSNTPCDPFGPLGDHCIAQGLYSVHPAGNPISHSMNEGLRHSVTGPRFDSPCWWIKAASVKVVPGFPFSIYPWRLLPTESIAVGVGHNDRSGSTMGRATVFCGNNIPFRIVPDFGNASKDCSQSPRSEVSRIFHDCVSGS